MSKLPSLQHLNLSFCNKVSDNGLCHLAELSSLLCLNVCYCYFITNDGLLHFLTKLASPLQHFNVCGCYLITDDGFRHFSNNLSSLQHLDVSGSEVTDVGLHHLSQLPSLQHLRLSFCKVTDDGSPSICEAFIVASALWMCTVVTKSLRTASKKLKHLCTRLGRLLTFFW